MPLLGTHRVGGAVARLRAGSPEAVTRPRFPQNAACGFPALRSSEGGSQHCESLQLPVREAQLWSQDRLPLLDLVEHLPRYASCPTPAAKHLVPVAFHRSMDLLQGTEVPGDAVIGVMAPQCGVESVDLFPDRQVPDLSQQVLQRHETAPQARCCRATDTTSIPRPLKLTMRAPGDRQGVKSASLCQ